MENTENNQTAKLDGVLFAEGVLPWDAVAENWIGSPSCNETQETLTDSPTVEVAKLESELTRLREIIARNVCQRMDGENWYLEETDYSDSLAILEAWVKEHGPIQPKKGPGL